MKTFTYGITLFITLVLAACATTPAQSVNASKTKNHLPIIAASAASYNQNIATRTKLLSEQGLNEVEYVGLRETAAKGTTTEYLVSKSNNTLYIAFTGSNAKNDWLRNLHAQYAPYANSPFPVHKGFVLSWHEVDSDITKIINQNKPTNIVVGGHSKGGAVAQVAGLSLIEQGYNVTQVVTLGAPPAFKIARDLPPAEFNTALANSNTLTRLNIITTHYVREYDYIQLASTGLAMNTKGIGKRISVKDDGSLYSDTNRLGAVMGLISNVEAAKAKKFDSRELHHHASTYLEVLKKSQ